MGFDKFFSLLYKINFLVAILGFLSVFYICIKKYLEDESVSDISYRYRDSQPRFVFCLLEPYKDDIPPHLGMVASNLSDLLRGDKGYPIDLAYSFDHGQALKNISDSLQEDTVVFRLTALRLMNGTFLRKDDLKMDYIRKSFARESCYELKSWDELGLLQAAFEIQHYHTAKSRKTLSAFMTMPNQFLSPDSVLIHQEGNEEYQTTVKVLTRSMKVFKGRSSRHNPCYEGDYDKMVLEKAMQEANCRPPYWSNANNYPNCTTKDQLYYLGFRPDSFELKEIRSSLLLPCNLMELDIVTDVTSRPSRRKDDTTIVTPSGKTFYKQRITFVFEYKTDFYTKNVQSRGFTGTSLDMPQLSIAKVNLVADLAGYLGLFLGYSVLQISTSLAFLAKILRCSVSGMNGKN